MRLWEFCCVQISTTVHGQDTHARFVGRDGCEEGCLCEVRRVSVCPVCRVCTGSLRCLFTGTCGERSTPGLRLFLRLFSRSRFSCGFVSLFGFGWMVVRFVRVIRLPACARVSRVSRVCPGSPGVFSPGRAVGFFSFHGPASFQPSFAVGASDHADLRENANRKDGTPPLASNLSHPRTHPHATAFSSPADHPRGRALRQH